MNDYTTVEQEFQRYLDLVGRSQQPPCRHTAAILTLCTCVSSLDAAIRSLQAQAPATAATPPQVQPDATGPAPTVGYMPQPLPSQIPNDVTNWPAFRLIPVVHVQEKDAV